MSNDALEHRLLEIETRLDALALRQDKTDVVVSHLSDNVSHMRRTVRAIKKDTRAVRLALKGAITFPRLLTAIQTITTIMTFYSMWQHWAVH